MLTSTKFVAEVSSNHNRSLPRCLSFVHEAAKIGCWGVKLQYFKLDKLFHNSAIAAKPELQARNQWELPLTFLPAIRAECDAYHMKLGITPFHVEGVAEILPYVDFYKIASYNILDQRLLTAVGETMKPIVVSTGMASLQEVMDAIDVIRETGNQQITLLHCVSDYPTEIFNCNLKAIQTLRELGYEAGWSDHSVQPSVVMRAVWHWHASMVEFHMDLDGDGKEFAKGHCWLPFEIREVITNLYCGTLADGDGRKQPRPNELFERDWRADPSDGLRPLVEQRWQMALDYAAQ